MTDLKRFLEYDKYSGRIVCELFSEGVPKTGTGTAVLEVPHELVLNTAACLVKDGEIVRAYETAEERRERERLARERAERSRLRVREILNEFVLAMLEQDSDRVGELRAEYGSLRKYL